MRNYYEVSEWVKERLESLGYDGFNIEYVSVDNIKWDSYRPRFNKGLIIDSYKKPLIKGNLWRNPWVYSIVEEKRNHPKSSNIVCRYLITESENRKNRCIKMIANDIYNFVEYSRVTANSRDWKNLLTLRTDFKKDFSDKNSYDLIMNSIDEQSVNFLLDVLSKKRLKWMEIRIDNKEYIQNYGEAKLCFDFINATFPFYSLLYNGISLDETNITVDNAHNHKSANEYTKLIKTFFDEPDEFDSLDAAVKYIIHRFIDINKEPPDSEIIYSAIDKLIKKR